MPPTRKDKSHVKPDDSNQKKPPSLRKMFVSVSRVKPYIGPKWNCQAPLRCCAYDKDYFEFSYLSFNQLQSVIEADLGVDVGEAERDDKGKDWCLIWHMFDSGQLGRVYDDESFRSAVEDHRRAYKSIVQFYIIESKGKAQLSLWMQKI